MWRDAQKLAESSYWAAGGKLDVLAHWQSWALASTLLIVWTGSCASLPDATCVKCKVECPSGLECLGGVCVERDADPVAVCGDKATGGGGGSGGTTATTDSSANTSAGTAGGSGGVGGTSGGSGGSGAADGGSGGSLAAGGEGGAAPPLGTGNNECGMDADCDPQIVTASQLPVVCANTPIDIELDAKCLCDTPGASRLKHWELLDGPAELSFDSNEHLTGVLGVGKYTFTASVYLDGRWTRQGSFELLAEPCSVLYVTESADSGPHVAAGSLVNGEVLLHLPVGLGEDAEVTSFDISPDGKFVAQVVALDSETSLELVEFGATPSLLDLEFPGTPVLHAFSDDSRWLAVLSTEPDIEPLTRLQLIDLGQQPPDEVASETIEHRGGLAWIDTSHFIYWGVVPGNVNFSEVHRRDVSDDGLGADGAIASARLASISPFVEFRVSPAGFAVLTEAQTTYYSLTKGETFGHPRPSIFSPGLDWMAFFDQDVMDLEPVDAEYDALAPPFGTVTGCVEVATWSANDESFACMIQAAPVIYTAQSGELVGDALPGGVQMATNRMSLSPNGAWFAYTPTTDGLVVVPKSEWPDFELGDVLIERGPGTNEWDFAFTPDEARLVVQRGRDLLVVDLQSGTPTVATIDGVSLPSVPACQLDSIPWLHRWCGAPYFRGNLVIADTGKHVAVSDPSQGVTVVDLATATPSILGPLAGGCSEKCIQFQ